MNLYICRTQASIKAQFYIYDDSINIDAWWLSAALLIKIQGSIQNGVFFCEKSEKEN